MRLGIVAASVALVLAAGSASAGTPNIAGVWHVQGRINYGGNFVDVSPNCTFRQAGGKLGGECGGPNARGSVTGLIAGDSVSWTWHHVSTTGVGVSANTSFNGTYVDAHLIRG